MRWKVSGTKKTSLVAATALLMAGASAPSAWGQTSPPACENGNCFAVFVMPDTQNYVYGQYNNLSPWTSFDGRGGLHLRRIMDWVCANKAGYVEESTGAWMEIALLIHLGDIVARGNNPRNEPEPYATGDPLPPCTANSCEWDRADAAFDVLDQCSMRYLVVPGNHDWDDAGSGNPFGPYTTTNQFNTYFAEGDAAQPGRAPWSAGNRCSGLGIDSCDWAAGQWYLGGGDDAVPESAGGNAIPVDSRTNGTYRGPPRHSRDAIGLGWSVLLGTSRFCSSDSSTPGAWSSLPDGRSLCSRQILMSRPSCSIMKAWRASPSSETNSSTTRARFS